MPLLLLLSHFSRVQLCATPKTAAHQAPPCLGFSRQEHWSGLPFPSAMHERKSESEVAQSCPTPSDPMDCSPPGSSVHGIFQSKVLEWGAIALRHILLQLIQLNTADLKNKAPNSSAQFSKLLFFFFQSFFLILLCLANPHCTEIERIR